MVALGIIGLGAIGAPLLAALDAGEAGAARCPAILVKRPRAGGDPRVTADPDAFFAHRLDAVVECAGHEAVRLHGTRVLEAGADLIVTAIGALTDDALRARLVDAAAASGRRLILPSAGIGSLDMLSAAAVGGLARVRVTVRKDPESWRGTHAEGLVDLAALPGPTTLYEGPVREGARLYPGNVNISAAAAFAGLGLDATELRIVADPTIETHVVEVEADGAFGRFTFAEDVLPTAENRKTGRIVGMALIKTVRNLSAPMVVGW